MSRELRAKLSDLPDGAAVRFDGGPFGVCLVRIAEDVYAVADRCSHQLWLLSDGEVDPYECTVECSKHGSTFSLKDGHPQCLPATQPVDAYPTRIEGDEVVVTLP